MKIKNFTALVCMLFVAQLSFGQITLEHEYNGIISVIKKHYDDSFSYKYMFADENVGIITIYNLDHSIYKTIKLDIPDGMKISTCGGLFTNVINSDELLELYFSLFGNSIYYTSIINENGEVIKTFENTSNVSIIADEEGFKLYVNTGPNYIYKTNIYSLPTKPSNIPALKPDNVSLPYPNPAKQTITIPYQLSGQWGTISIYNASGQFVEQKNVDKNFSNLLLDVSGYAKGMYYYKVDKQKGEFMVN